MGAEADESSGRRHMADHLSSLTSQGYESATLQRLVPSTAHHHEVRMYFVEGEYAYAVATPPTAGSTAVGSEANGVEVSSSTTFEDEAMAVDATSLAAGERGRLPLDLKAKLLVLGTLALKVQPAPAHAYPVARVDFLCCLDEEKGEEGGQAAEGSEREELVDDVLDDGRVGTAADGATDGGATEWDSIKAHKASQPPHLLPLASPPRLASRLASRVWFINELQQSNADLMLHEVGGCDAEGRPIAHLIADRVAAAYARSVSKHRSGAKAQPPPPPIATPTRSAIDWGRTAAAAKASSKAQRPRRSMKGHGHWPHGHSPHAHHPHHPCVNAPQIF